MGCIVGAAHWSPFVISGRGFLAFGSFVVFAQSLLLIFLAAVAGTLSANAGLLLVLGYAIGEYLLGGPQLTSGPPSLIPGFFHLRLPLFICYGFFYLVAVRPIFCTRLLLGGLFQKEKEENNRLWLIRIGVAAAFQAILIYAWTLVAPMVMRIVWTWSDTLADINVPDYCRVTDPWLPLVAIVATVARGLAEDSAMRHTAVRDRVFRLHRVLQRADRVLMLFRRWPLLLHTIFTASVVTLLVSGFVGSALTGVAIFFTFAVLLSVRVLALPKLPSWNTWSGICQRVPLPIRIAIAALIAFFVTRGNLLLDPSGGLSGLTRKEGAFGLELLSIGLGLITLLILIPEGPEVDASALRSSSAEKKIGLEPRRFSKNATLALAVLLLTASEVHGELCLDPRCCFLTAFLAALVIAAVVVLAWEIIVPLLSSALTRQGLILLGRSLLMYGPPLAALLEEEGPEAGAELENMAAAEGNALISQVSNLEHLIESEAETAKDTILELTPRIHIAADSAQNAENLLASENQMNEAGHIMAGPGGRVPFRNAEAVAREYGGSALDWVKKTSSSYTPSNSAPFQTHWVENLKTGQRVEFKTKFPWEY